MTVKPVTAALAAAVAAVLAQPVWSQDNSNGGLEEIVVTATRREQNLQDVPLAVQAYTGEMLERQSIENMEGLKAVVPNLVVAGNLGGSDTAQFTIRGIPNVGTYIDGIWQVSNNGLLLREFVDLDRVEVLRGPQGTLYGRDSTGGAIRLYTKPPGREFGGQVDMSLGNLDRHDVKGMIDLPFTDTFRSRFTVGNYDREGYVTSKTTGFKTGGFEDQVARADFIWEPSDRVSLRFNAQSDKIVETQARVDTYIDPQIAWNSGFQVGLSQAFDIASGGHYNCHYACSGFPGGLLDKWESRQDITVPSRQWLEQQSVDLKVDMTDKVKFEYLLGHTYADTRQYNDWDAGEFNFYIDYFLNELDLTSHEFQFSGGNDRFTWVGGLYSWEQTGHARNPAFSMANWIEAQPNYPNHTPEFSYANQVLPSAACQATPAQRGITSWAPHVAAGYLPRFPFGPTGPDVLALDVNSVNGWPYPCNWIPGAGWVGALAAGARPPAGDTLNRTDIDGWAAFGEVTVSLTEKFNLTLGYRHHDQSSDQVQYDIDAGVAAGVTAAKPIGPNLEFSGGGIYDGIANAATATHVGFDDDTYRLAASWKFADQMMLYFGYTEGFNSGGLAIYDDSLGPVQSSYDPETIENYELGLRSDLANGKLRLNVTYFDTDWLNIQLLATVTDRQTGQELTELVSRNAASANANGVEVELSYAPTDKLLLQANLGFLDTEYTSTKSPQVSLRTEFAAAPENTYMLGFQYTSNLPKGGSLVWRMDEAYTGAYWRSPVPSLRQNAYGVPRDKESGDFWRLDAQLAYTPPSDRYSLTLYGTNLTNVYDLNSGFLHNIWQFDFATVSRPREVGATIRLKF
ncbi:MAG TPA: TonB-dependent receptor [Gammaproteobacteria bacterium]|nr:TonB-dependent receptor [Gammaproteobacteria bacterium]